VDVLGIEICNAGAMTGLLVTVVHLDRRRHDLAERGRTITTKRKRCYQQPSLELMHRELPAATSVMRQPRAPKLCRSPQSLVCLVAFVRDFTSIIYSRLD
jgi:hypothetical protein